MTKNPPPEPIMINVFVSNPSFFLSFTLADCGVFKVFSPELSVTFCCPGLVGLLPAPAFNVGDGVVGLTVGDLVGFYKAIIINFGMFC